MNVFPVDSFENGRLAYSNEVERQPLLIRPFLAPALSKPLIWSLMSI